MTDLSLAAALGVTKFVTTIAVILATLCCAPLVQLRCSLGVIKLITIIAMPLRDIRRER
jgi:hypothetical protein